MRAVTITRHGPPSVLQVVSSEDPTPKPHEVRIDVRASGLNFAEVSARQGLYPDAPKPPCVVGYEVSGVVDAVGSDVQSLRVGDRVLAMTRFGGHASSVVVPEDYAFKMPAAMTFAEGAALPVNYLTAHHMLFYLGSVHPRSTLLVHMAAGGVGTAVFQLVKGIPGLVTFGTASASKHEYLRGLGCTHPIDYNTQDWTAVVREKTHGRGVDLILDAIGGASWKKGYAALSPAGRLVCFGFSAAIDGDRRSLLTLLRGLLGVPIFQPLGLMDTNRTVQGCNMGHLWNELSILRPQIERLLALYEEGTVRPHVDAEVPFSRAAEAHAMLEQRKNKGKVVLIPD